MGLSQEFSILLFFFIKNFSREPCAGNLVYVCLFKREQKGGAGGRFWPRSDAISDPIKPFKINRVPAKSRNCSGLASRMKKPSAKAGRFRLVRVARFM